MDIATLAIIGPSGCGKSSLLNAGVLPLLALRSNTPASTAACTEQAQRRCAHPAPPARLTLGRQGEGQAAAVCVRRGP